MPKTNHSRNFIDTRDYSIDGMITRNCEIGAMGHNFTNGKHGAAKNRKGCKKYVISRKRFHDKAVLQKFDTEKEY
jgi:hypothetical protein